MTSAIIDPTRSSAAAAGSAASSPRVPTLEGLRVALLENTKSNAAAILDAVADALTEHESIGAVSRFTVPAFAMPLPEDFVADIVSKSDVVVIGVGDCGSCSAAAVADGIAFEAAGLPSAVICTEAFVVPSNAMAGLKGRPDFVYLTTPHPIANLTPEQIRERGTQIAERVRERLVEAPVLVGAGR